MFQWREWLCQCEKFRMPTEWWTNQFNYNLVLVFCIGRNQLTERFKVEKWHNYCVLMRAWYTHGTASRISFRFCILNNLNPAFMIPGLVLKRSSVGETAMCKYQQCCTHTVQIWITYYFLGPMLSSGCNGCCAALDVRKWYNFFILSSVILIT